VAHLQGTDQNTEPTAFPRVIPILPNPVNTDFLTGGGEMGALMRAHDCMQSPLGTPAQWPDALTDSEESPKWLR